VNGRAGLNAPEGGWLDGQEPNFGKRVCLLRALGSIADMAGVAHRADRPGLTGRNVIFSGSDARPDHRVGIAQ
jgi:hypothetical protein